MSDTERGETPSRRPPEPEPPKKHPGEAPGDRPDPASGGAMPDSPQGDEVDPGLG